MAVNLKELRERRDALAKNLHALLENNPGDKWGPDQQKVYDDGMAEIERITGIIAKIDTALALPDIFTRDPKQAAQLSKARAGAESALQRAEEEWLEASALDGEAAS